MRILNQEIKNIINNKECLEKEYSKGKSLKMIANELNVNLTTIFKRFRKFNIQCRKNGWDSKKSEQTRKKMSESRKIYWENLDEDSKNKFKLKLSKTKTKHGICQGRKRAYVLNRGVVFDYRLKMEEKLGRQLLCDEVIHHKDGNPLNCDINNLEIMSFSEHSREHYKQRKINEKGQLI